MNSRRISRLGRPFYGSEPGRAFPVVRCLLSAALVLTTLAPLDGEDLWSERRRAVRSRGAWENAAGGLVAASTPGLSEVLPSASEAWGRKKNGPFPEGPWASPAADALPRWLRSTLGLHGEVREVRLPVPSPRRIVVHLQDLHDVEEAQRNISGLLEQLSLSRRSPLVVGLEGASGGFDLGPLRGFTDPHSLRRGADWLLSRQVLSGAEHFGLLTASPARLVGVEDPSLYGEHAAALQDSFESQTADDALLARTTGLVEGLKAKIFPPELLELDRRESAYEEGRLSLGDFVSGLTRGAPPSDLGPETRLFLETLATEKEVDPSRVSFERQQFLERLSPLLTENEARRLVDTGLDVRLGRAPYARFHEALGALASAHDVPLSKFPAYAAYERSRVRGEKLDGQRLMAEVEALGRRRCEALSPDASQKALVQIVEDLRILRRLNAFGLTPEDRDRFQARRKDIGRLPERVAALAREAGGHPRNLPALADLLRRHEIFYLLAERRNAPLVDRLLNELGPAAPAEGPSVGVLVAGGFHAPGVRDELLRRGVGYIALSPRLTDTGNLSSSLDAFRPGRTPVDRILSGARLAINRPLFTARRPLTSRETIFRSIGLFAVALAALTIAGIAVEGLPAPLDPGKILTLGDLPAPIQDQIQLLTAGFTERATHFPTGPLDLSLSAGDLTLAAAAGGVAVAVPARVSERKGRGRWSGGVRVFVSDAGGGRAASVHFASGDDVFRMAVDAWKTYVAVPVHSGLKVLRGLNASPWEFDKWLGPKVALDGARRVNTIRNITLGVVTLGASGFKTAFQKLNWTAWEKRAKGWENRLAGWKQTLWDDEMESWVNLVRHTASASLQRHFFFSLAGHEKMNLEKAWESRILETLAVLGVSAKTHADGAAVPGEPASFRVLLSLKGGGNQAMVFRASNSPALFKRGGYDALLQPSPNLDAVEREVWIQQEVFQDPGQLLKFGFRAFIQEIQSMRANPALSLAEAQSLARPPLEERQVELARLRHQLSLAIASYDNDLLGGALSVVDVRENDLSDGATPDLLGATLRARPFSVTDAISEDDPFLKTFGLARLLGAGSSPYEDGTSLARLLARRGSRNPGAAANPLALDHLDELIGVYRRLELHLESRFRVGRFFSSRSVRARSSEALSDFVLSLASFAGRRAGESAAWEAPAGSVAAPGLVDRALRDSRTAGFAPMAEVVLAALANGGVDAAVLNDPLSPILPDLFTRYADAFRRAFQRMTPMSPDDVAKHAPSFPGLSAGVFHAPAAEVPSGINALLDILIARGKYGSLDRFLPVFLLDEPGPLMTPAGDAEIALQRRGDFRALSETTRRAVADALRRMLVAEAGEFLVEGKISQAKLFGLVTGQAGARPLGQIEIFMTDKSRLLQDASESLVGWILYLITPDGLRRFSESASGMEAEKRIRDFIARHA